MTRKRITTEQIEKAFELGIKSFNDNISVSNFKPVLVNDFDMNPSSAQGYIETVGELLTGHCYTRTINTQATEYYLSQIYQRYPLTSLNLAIEAVRKHLDYYLSKTSSPQEPIRLIYEKYAIICEQEFDHDDFEDKVIIAKKDSSESRLFRLKSAPKQAKLIDAKTKLYRRNPDVVAETLYRAKGTCERCKQEAPFLRKKDNSPYLEVHHIKMLSAGGLDWTENTEALCPNCHREKHFG
ncbi:MAG: 5-methylcytosine-specific restriction protein A [Psychromonas sp.]|jgi:5-methylcytosine-specific restriction protein A|uniref:HNH endonuclease n=1 Tax=Psychromonas sp. TaxID=1884585 RepID=UPI0039E40AA4